MKLTDAQAHDIAEKAVAYVKILPPFTPSKHYERLAAAVRAAEPKRYRVRGTAMRLSYVGDDIKVEWGVADDITLSGVLSVEEVRP